MASATTAVHPSKSKTASRAIRVTEEVFAELVRRQAARYKVEGKRTSLAALVAEAVKKS